MKYEAEIPKCGKKCLWRKKFFDKESGKVKEEDDDEEESEDDEEEEIENDEK